MSATALRDTSQTLREFLKQAFLSDLALSGPFSSSMTVSLSTPEEMTQSGGQGLSVWLFQVVRDPERLNAPPDRDQASGFIRHALPFRLRYLLTPLSSASGTSGTDTELLILGRVLQALDDHPRLYGTDLQGELGTQAPAVELFARLEPLSLEEITRVWEALQRSYQLSVSYEVTVVYVRSAREAPEPRRVEVVIPEYKLIVGRTGSS